jgi:signal transduction histidine kinase
MRAICWIFFFWSFTTFGQQAPNFADSVSLISTDSVKTYIKAGRHTRFTVRSHRIPTQAFDTFSHRALRHNNTPLQIPADWHGKWIYLRFNLVNPDTSGRTIFFFPGVSYLHTVVQRKINGTWQSDPWARSEAGFYPLQLPPGETAEFVVEMKSAKTVVSSYVWHFIDASYQKDYKILFEERTFNHHLIGFLYCGILLMMFVYSFGSYRSTGRREFLYNAIYVSCMFAIVFFNNYFDKKSHLLSAFFYGYAGLALLVIGSIAYVQFTRNFLNTFVRYPKLDRIFVRYMLIIAFLLLVFSVLYFFTPFYFIQDIIENLIKLVSIAVGVVYIRKAFTQKDPLMNFLAWGNAMLIGFGLTSLLVNFFFRRPHIFGNALFYYETGIVLEVTLFFLGLMYKNRQTLIEKIKEQEAFKRETEKTLYESQLALLNARQVERSRISADMHDDLGAGVTAIRLYSELAKNKVAKDIVPELDKISQFANDLLGNLNSIIWTMNAGNDSLYGTLSYLRNYITDYLDGTGIKHQFDFDSDLPDVPIRGEVRRNLFLVFKESMNNMVKHADATEVKIACRLEKDSGIHWLIQDNGKGIDFDHLRPFSNGLSNMEKRMRDSGIRFQLESNKDGTSIHLFQPIQLVIDGSTTQMPTSTTQQ